MLVHDINTDNRYIAPETLAQCNTQAKALGWEKPNFMFWEWPEEGTAAVNGKNVASANLDTILGQ